MSIVCEFLLRHHQRNYYIEFDKIASVWTPFLMESQLRWKEQTIRKSFLVYANFNLLRLALKRGILNILLSHIFGKC